jgi:hypothetical protein
MPNICLVWNQLPPPSILDGVGSRSVLGTAGVIVVLMIGCSASSHPASTTPSPSSTRTSMPVTAAGCIDGTVVDLVGIQGVIGAGPFASNRDY